jgi:hypothetical protein
MNQVFVVESSSSDLAGPLNGPANVEFAIPEGKPRVNNCGACDTVNPAPNAA